MGPGLQEEEGIREEMLLLLLRYEIAIFCVLGICANERTGARKSGGETDGEARAAAECAEDAEEDRYAAGS